MEARELGYFVRASGGRLLRGDSSRLISGIGLDTRALGAGELFVAVGGERFDGHHFLGEAERRGAAAVMVAEGRAGEAPAGVAVVEVEDPRGALGRMAARYREDFAVEAVAVVGSNGKTTTKNLIAAVLGEAERVVASESSFNNEIGVPLTLLRLDRGVRWGVFEAGTNHPGELRPLLGMIRPRIGVLTSIGGEHLEHFGSLAGVIEEEGAIAEALGEGGVLVVNGGAEGVDAVVARLPEGRRVVRVGVGSGMDWGVRVERVESSGTRFCVETEADGWSGAWETPLVGEHMALNTALALAVASECGVAPELARRGLGKTRPAKQRLTLEEVGGVSLLDDSYNANADSIRAALKTLSDLPCAGRRVAVLGDMAELGRHAETAHGEVGKYAAECGIDRLVLVGKSAGITARAAREGGLRSVFECGDAEEAVQRLLGELRPGDRVLVKASRSGRLERVSDGLRMGLGSKGTLSGKAAA